MNFLKNKQTRVLIIILSTLVFISVVVFHFYYKYINESTDPRVVEANLLYEKYNKYVEENNFNEIFLLMDSIENIYLKYPHYSNSYEVGVAYNNRAATYIAMALDSSLCDSIKKDSILDIAKYNSSRSIDIYTSWLDFWQNKSEEEILEYLSDNFFTNEDLKNIESKERYINKRTNQIIEAQYETPRRLSVSYTNLGLVSRHKKQYEDAIEHYFTALELWPDNLAAENNINVLLAKPMKKRGILRKIFPKSRTEN